MNDAPDIALLTTLLIGMMLASIESVRWQMQWQWVSVIPAYRVERADTLDTLRLALDGQAVMLTLAFVLALIANLAFVLIVFRLMRQVVRLRERNASERARILAQAELLALDETSQRMSEFLHIAGHELRTPLTTIRANLQLAERRVQRTATHAAANGAAVDGQLEPLLTLLGRALSAANRQDRLVTALLDVSRIQSGKLSLEFAVFDLVVLVREVTANQQRAHLRRVLSVEAPETAAPVLADRDRIGQVVTQYLANALKYSEETRPVLVSVTTGDGNARVGVRDEGPGIAAQEYERVWELFYRAPGVEPTSGSEIGLGLGLHISKTIIERHGGAVGVESRTGEGSTFWFTLPLIVTE